MNMIRMKIRYINHNIIILISSYPFISLINCPWLLFHGIILLSYSYFFILFMMQENAAPTTGPASRTSSFGRGGSTRMQMMSRRGGANSKAAGRGLSRVLFVLSLSFADYWMRDVIREVMKIYEVLPAGLFIVFLIFVFSEGMLFLSFFWASFHSPCSKGAFGAPKPGLYVPGPCELTYTNTLLLTDAALSLGYPFIGREFISNQDNNDNMFSMFLQAWTFITLQIKEFRADVAFYINDSILGSIFYFLTGLHFFHVIVGIILIGIILCIVSSLIIRILPFNLYYNLQIIYWHFIELIWIFLYLIIYSY